MLVLCCLFCSLLLLLLFLTELSNSNRTIIKCTHVNLSRQKTKIIQITHYTDVFYTSLRLTLRFEYRNNTLGAQPFAHFLHKVWKKGDHLDIKTPDIVSKTFSTTVLLFHHNFLKVHPNPKRASHLKLKYYEFAGRIVGKCLYESSRDATRRQNVKARFTRSFLAQLLGLRVNCRVSKDWVTGANSIKKLQV